MKGIWFGLGVLVLMAGLSLAATPLSECGSYPAGDYYLTRDVTSVTTNCLRFSGASATLDCGGHWVNGGLRGVYTWSAAISNHVSQAKTLLIKNCKISGSVGINSANSVLKVENTFFEVDYAGIEAATGVGSYGRNLSFAETMMEGDVYPLEIAGEFDVFDSPYQAFWVSSVYGGTIDWFYTVKIKFVDSVSGQPLSGVKGTLRNAQGGVVSFTTGRDGTYNAPYILMGTLWDKPNGWPTAEGTYYNPFEVTFYKQGYRVVHNTNYILVDAVDAKVELVRE